MSVTDTPTRFQAAHEEALARVPAALTTLKQYHQLSNRAIGDSMGEPMHFVQERMSGHTKCSAAELRMFAVFFQVPMDVLYLEPDDALRWVLEHGPARGDLPFLASGWMSLAA